MKTKILKINSRTPVADKIREASDLIKKGELVAFPTETVYGLGANALDKNAVKKIFIAKGRPGDNPLIVHISDKKDLEKLTAEVPKIAKKLIKKFWPGPLTLIFKKSEIIPSEITAGLETVAIRMPKSKIALQLIKKSGCPIAAPSANSSGKPSPTIARHVFQDLNKKIPLIIDGGKTKIGLESTVLDITTSPPSILRPGKITREQIEKIVKLGESTAKINTTKSPGIKYKHYAPSARVILIERNEISKYKSLFKNKKIKLILKKDSANNFAKNLFSEFRKADENKFDIILIEKVPKVGIGVAIMNRLEKASSKK